MKVNIMWFRRDLRLDDNAALYHALKAGIPVVPVFIFDKNILDKLDNAFDSRVTFIHDAVTDLHDELMASGSGMHVLYANAEDGWKDLMDQYDINCVFTNEDYEGYAIQRDDRIAGLLKQRGIDCKKYKDHVIFEKDEVVKDNNEPYTVFTPYSKKWRTLLNDFYLKEYPVNRYVRNFYQSKPQAIPSLKQMGFTKSALSFPPRIVKSSLIRHYAEQRDIPSADGTSRLGIHLRFGTLSIRKLAAYCMPLSHTFINELIWRDFYQMILHHFPHINKGLSFKPAYDNIEWRNNEEEFEAWCNGQTGYPIVDAGMRELNSTGYMHNRVRMITASFLTKHLLIDWRWGESYFAAKLLDFDFASNNGGWQWAAGSGCDAAPYFRIFNPSLQTEKFDPQKKYIRQWVPEFGSDTYPGTIVDHSFARNRALETYKRALN